VPAAPPPGAAGGVLPDRGAEAGAALPREPALDEIAEQLLAHGGHSLDAVEDSLVRAALARSGGNVSRAALLLGLTRAQMAYRARKLVPG
jgi:transcriptional regulator with GAF, ATPase, and Fis domain